MNNHNIKSAITAARAAVEFDLQHDVSTRNKALICLWDAAEYWLTPRRYTTAEYRGDRVPPKMIRMPGKQRNLRWAGNQMRAARAWAAEQ